MEKQEILNKEVGNIEPERTMLAPAKVKIVSVDIEDTAKAKKVVFECKHPNKEETIKISSVSRIVEKQIKATGTWLNLDKEEKLQKGSALADFLKFLDIKTLSEAVNKEVVTELDGNYLCFKGY